MFEQNFPIIDIFIVQFYLCTICLTWIINKTRKIFYRWLPTVSCALSYFYNSTSLKFFGKAVKIISSSLFNDSDVRYLDHRTSWTLLFLRFSGTKFHEKQKSLEINMYSESFEKMRVERWLIIESDRNVGNYL